jgi:hypothetical protein
VSRITFDATISADDPSTVFLQEDTLERAKIYFCEIKGHGPLKGAIFRSSGSSPGAAAEFAYRALMHGLLEARKLGRKWDFEKDRS